MTPIKVASSSYSPEDIIKYVMTTINNTNSAILLEMLNNLRLEEDKPHLKD